MIDRLFLFITYLGVSIAQFERNIHSSSGMLRRAISQKTDIQSKWLQIICENYPELNIEWLITGRGEMLKNNESNLTLDTLLSIIEKKDARIEELCHKVGRLEEQLNNGRNK